MLTLLKQGKLTAPDLSLNFGSFKLQTAFASIRNNSEYPKSQIKPHDSPSEIHKGNHGEKYDKEAIFLDLMYGFHTMPTFLKYIFLCPTHIARSTILHVQR